MDCEVIGLLHYYEGSKLCTLADLKEHIKDTEEYKKFLDSDPDWGKLQVKTFTLKDYCDRRKHTDLTRFNYCPVCGKEINWKQMGGKE